MVTDGFGCNWRTDYLRNCSTAFSATKEMCQLVSAMLLRVNLMRQIGIACQKTRNQNFFSEETRDHQCFLSVLIPPLIREQCDRDRFKVSTQQPAQTILVLLCCAVLSEKQNWS